MIFRPLKRLAGRVVRRVGLDGAVRRVCSNGPIVVAFHGVEEEISDPEIQAIHAPLALFERQVDYLRKKFEVVSLGHLQDCLSRQSGLRPGQAAITFDDGYRNNLTVAAPVLAAHDLPFTVFISTRHVSDNRRFPTYYLRAALKFTDLKHVHLDSLNLEFDLDGPAQRQAAGAAISKAMKSLPLDTVDRVIEDLIGLVPAERWAEINGRFGSDAPLTWPEVKRLKEMGATIGSHCHDHAILHQAQSEDEVVRQLEKSKSLIEQESGGPCFALAYPNGKEADISPFAARAVARAGYGLAFTGLEGEVTAGQNPALLPRMNTSSDLGSFKAVLNSAWRYNKGMRRWQAGYR